MVTGDPAGVPGENGEAVQGNRTVPAGEMPFTDARVAAAFYYWRRKRAGRSMPSRADIDATEIPKLLPDLMLVDVLGDGRYRYRLIGAENARAQGVNATGRYLDEVIPGLEYKAHVTALYDECVRQRRPLYSECQFFSPQQQAPERHTKVLFLPLSDDDATVNAVMVAQVFIYIAQVSRDRHFIDAPAYRETTHVLL